MSQTGIKPELNPELYLDQLLVGMAEDVPPMPADFHDKWMNAIRTEIKQSSPVSQWPKILSIAAVFVFLIGGTLIYRSVRKPILPENGSVNTAAVTEIIETNNTSMSETTVAGSAMEKAADSAVEADLRMDTASEADFTAVNSAEEAPVIAMDSAWEAAYEAESMEEAQEAYDGAMEEAEEAETRPAVKMTAKAPAAEITPTEVPATEAPASASVAREGVGGFFADMGDFLLTVWPYLLIVLVLLAIAAAVKKFRKKE